MNKLDKTVICLIIILFVGSSVAITHSMDKLSYDQEKCTAIGGVVVARADSGHLCVREAK